MYETVGDKHNNANLSFHLFNYYQNLGWTMQLYQDAYFWETYIKTFEQSVLK